MKKIIALFLLTLAVFIAGCQVNYNEYPSSEKKPSIDYYTNLMISELNENLHFQAKLLETNYSKEVSLKEDGKYTILNFLSSLEKESFIKQSEPLQEMPKFKLYINTDKGGYVINIYNEEIISVHPWDGVYNEDFISMKAVPKAYNLHGLCNYIINNL